MLSLELIIVIGLLFGLVLCCLIVTLLAPGHVTISEEEAQNSADLANQPLNPGQRMVPLGQNDSSATTKR
jgi:hypothetical protein